MKKLLIAATGLLLAGGTLASAVGLDPVSGSVSNSDCRPDAPPAQGGPAPQAQPPQAVPGTDLEAGGAAPAAPARTRARVAGTQRTFIPPGTPEGEDAERLYGLTTSPLADVWQVVGAKQPRVDLDLTEVPAPEALKRVFEQAKVGYRLDADVPREARVTVKAQNIQLHTALNLITEAAGVGWTVEQKLAAALTLPEDTSKEERAKLLAEAAVVTYRVGKTISTRTLLPRMLFHGKEGVVAPSLQLSETLVPFTVYGREERSTFTCPHCKQQSTMVRVKQQPKCPKCARVYQPEWQFCPADGTRRPAPPGEWRFCPACGKQVMPEKAEDPGEPSERATPAPGRRGEGESPLEPVAHTEAGGRS